ncbi:MAG: nitrogenase cofactor biosynthesis protein NifB [Desulfobacterales bacterium]|nr:nitrogenase cofactor biosynthesis protein NifB [Desulfobacterales bacterium]
MNIKNHPCFNPGACKDYGRVHLPVAPRCNIQCNFCNRKFDCVNESRPGVTSSILKPFQAMNYLDEVMSKKKDIAVVGIAGPGDPFANAAETLTTLKLVKEKYPDMLLCVATNGLNLPDWMDEVKQLDVTHVSVTVNAVDPLIAEKIYAWVRFGKRSLAPEQGARLLLERQIESIKGLKQRGIIVKINTIVLPGINDHHVGDIAKKMGELDVDLLNCMAYLPSKGSNFSHLEEPSKEMMNDIRSNAEPYVPQMLHCTRCRADAVGKLNEKTDVSLMDSLIKHATDTKRIENNKPVEDKKTGLVAVATREGVLVNQHLGEATHLNIYDINKEKLILVDKRQTPETGGKDLRWQKLAQIIRDCDLLLVNGIGEAPKDILTNKGIKILEVNGMINEVVYAVKNNKDINHLIAREHSGCGESCNGAGLGCM